VSAPKTLVELFAEPGRKIAERNTATERERAAVVAWLREMADRRLEVFADESDCRNEPRNPCLVGAEAFSEAANAIERGEHLTA